MNKSETIVNLAKALSQAQGEMPVIKFNSVNPFLKNNYADLGAIIAGTRPVLAKYGLAVTQLTFGEDGVVGVETMLTHNSGEWISERVSMQVGEERGKSSAQVAGSIVTYLRRYALASILGVYADEDGDGNKPAPAELKAREEKKPVEAKPVSESDPMTIEDACKVRSESANKSYGAMTIGDLSVRYNALVKALKDNGLSDEQRAEKTYKMRAAKMVIDAKRNKEI
jgi:hypothetical protein